MLGLGLAFSHAPAMFCPAELWPAPVVDYVPAHHVKAGLGFAYWPPREA